MNRSVLVVDDEPGIIEIASAYLRREGFRVRTARDGAPGFDSVATQMPDLVVLDLMLPDLSGEDVCVSLRRHSSVPILMLTAKSAEVQPAARARPRGRRLPGEALLAARARGPSARHPAALERLARPARRSAGDRRRPPRGRSGRTRGAPRRLSAAPDGHGVSAPGRARAPAAPGLLAVRAPRDAPGPGRRGLRADGGRARDAPPKEDGRDGSRGRPSA